MKTFFHNLLRWFSPTISRRAALGIARDKIAPDRGTLSVYGLKPPNVNLYNLPLEPCWYVIAPWGDGYYGTMLRSSRVVLVSKFSG